MAIERIERSDTFARFSGYFIRTTDIKSKALGVIHPGEKPSVLTTLDEHYYQIYHKSAYSTTHEFVDDYPTLEEAEKALKILNEE